MYLCPRCEKQYPEAPEQCVQCKRPLILNKRFRIEMSIESGPAGEDFDVVDLKTNEPVILRELRVRKADATARQDEIQRYKQNRERLKGMKYEGNKVLIDAFEAEYKNSVCYYLAFDAEAWASLGDELYIGSGEGGGDDGGEELPPVEGRDLDPELAAMLAKIEGGGGDAAPAKEEKGGALVKANGDKAPAKKADGGGAVASKAKVIVGVSLLVIILAAVAAIFLI